MTLPRQTTNSVVDQLENTRSTDGIFYHPMRICTSAIAYNDERMSYIRMRLRGGVDFCSGLDSACLMSLSNKSHLTGRRYHTRPACPIPIMP